MGIFMLEVTLVTEQGSTCLLQYLPVGGAVEQFGFS